MKALLQRVRHAKVSVDEEVIGEIAQGLLVLLGVEHTDTAQDADVLAEKTAHLRIFSDEEGKFNYSALDLSLAVLVVSQFTLLADTRRGRRPSFTGAAPPHIAEPLVERFVGAVRGLSLPVATGKFGAHMLVSLENDGPVTLMLDSKSS